LAWEFERSKKNIHLKRKGGENEKGKIFICDDIGDHGGDSHFWSEFRLPG
jgi:hypothetical protein